MNKIISITKGIVKEVFFPNNDVHSNKLGFIVNTENGEITITNTQNMRNIKIYKNDKVSIVKQMILGHEYLSIVKEESNGNI